MRDPLDLLQLAHHLVADLQPPGRIQQHHVVCALAGAPHGMGHDLRRRHARAFAVNRDVELFTQHLKLRHGGGPIRIGGHHQRAAVIALTQRQRQLGGGRRLACALQPHQHDHVRRGAGHIQLRRFAQRAQQLLVNDLHNLLRRRQAFHHLGADGPLSHARHQVLDNLEVDVGFQQRQTHLAQRHVNVLLRQLAVRRQLIKDSVQLGLQVLEHAAFRSVGLFFIGARARAGP